MLLMAKKVSQIKTLPECFKIQLKKQQLRKSVNEIAQILKHLTF